MVQVETSGWRMVRIASGGTSRAYEVYDDGGRHLGRVEAPDGPPRLGAGAATVLLHRDGEVSGPLR